MIEADALKAVARAQKALLTLTKHNLRHDQSDGLRAAAEAKEHSEFYFKLKEEWLSSGLIDDSDAEAADKIAGFKS